MRDLNSDAVRCARVLCIVFMSYVHLHFDIDPNAEFPLVDALFVETLGRSSVPLLSVISGYFMVGFFQRRQYFEAIIQRAKTLILPMVIWNTIAVLLLGQKKGRFGTTFSPSPSARS